MGRPKALLPFDGLPLIVHVVDRLRSVCPEVVVVAAPGQDLPSLPVTLARDDVAYQGPVGGIAYGIAAASGEACFVTSCDSVFLDTRLVTRLFSRLEGHDVVVPRWNGRLQPLHAVYRRTVLPLLHGQLERHELRPVQLFDKVRTLTLDEAHVREIDPEGWSFFNMNTPGDYAEALKRWEQVRAGGDGTSEPSARCTVELFGVARLLARTREVSIALPEGATLAHVLAGLAERLPVLVGQVITPDRAGLVDGYACNVNGLDFVRSPGAPVAPGDSIVILAADAGG
jgi:molybdopterin-guanine dinucleotide biosynthesis protein A